MDQPREYEFREEISRENSGHFRVVQWQGMAQLRPSAAESVSPTGA
jgi:hypothetical protein